MNLDNLVTVKEAAKAMGISVTSVYKLARARRIPSYMAGPKMTGIRFSIPEVKEALKRRSLDEAAPSTEVICR